MTTRPTLRGRRPRRLTGPALADPTSGAASGTSPRQRRSLRAGVLATGAVAALALTACAEPTPTVTDGGTVAPATAVPTTTAPATAGGSAGTASGSASSTKPAARPFPGDTIAVGRTIVDTGLGHRIRVTRILRDLPWPDGYEASAEAYELVAVEMTWTPSTTYTAPIRLQDLSIATGSPFPGRPDSIIDAVAKAHQLDLLPAQVSDGKTASGWAIFKVGPKDAPTMRLDYTRPKSEVTDSGVVFDSKVFSTSLVGG